jgi:hypothetical protein
LVNEGDHRLVWLVNTYVDKKILNCVHRVQSKT